MGFPPDFVEVVIHSYRHRFGTTPGAPALEATEQRLAAQPPIRVPTVVLHGGGGVTPPEGSVEHARYFTGPFERRVIPMAGHNLRQEMPGPVVEAVLALLSR